jgi:predicted DNA-binding protein YlxM (UPF0122 family)
MNKTPKTPAEVFRFADNSVNELTRDIEHKLSIIHQINARTADALTDYETVLKTIAKNSSCEDSKSDAKWVLKRHKIKK